MIMSDPQPEIPAPGWYDATFDHCVEGIDYWDKSSGSKVPTAMEPEDKDAAPPPSMTKRNWIQFAFVLHGVKKVGGGSFFAMTKRYTNKGSNDGKLNLLLSKMAPDLNGSNFDDEALIGRQYRIKVGHWKSPKGSIFTDVEEFEDPKGGGTAGGTSGSIEGEIPPYNERD